VHDRGQVFHSYPLKVTAIMHVPEAVDDIAAIMHVA
jgi:hypothetical protein